jgi:hypothetical protein
LHTKKILITLIFSISILIPQRNISADVGPKSSMEFTFLQNGTQPEIEIIRGILYICEQSDCQDAHIVSEPQYTGERDLSCTEYHCYASLNGSYYQLEVTFSDGVTRKSNVFTKRFYVSEYSVIIKDNTLDVKEESGNNLSIFFFTMIFLFCPASLLIFTIIVTGTAIYSFTKKDKKSVLKSRLAAELKWSIFIFLFIAGTILHPQAFISTVIIECLLIYIYQRYQKIPYKEISAGVFIANLITHPIFVFIVMYFRIQSITIIVGHEVVIWLIEALIVYSFAKEIYSLKRILILSLVLNFFSFSVGLLLPI